VLYESPALDIALASASAESASGDGQPQDMRFDGVTSRRLLLPGYVVTYSTFGIELRAIVNGYTGEVWGWQQETASARLLANAASAFFSGVTNKWVEACAAVFTVLCKASPALAKTVVTLLLQPIFRVATKIVFFPPVFVTAVLSLSGLFAHATLAPFRCSTQLRPPSARRLTRALQLREAAVPAVGGDACCADADAGQDAGRVEIPQQRWHKQSNIPQRQW
jgi:hypothetical protein